MSASFLLRKDFRKQPPRWSQESPALAASRPRREAQAVRARVTLNPLLAAFRLKAVAYRV